MQEENIKEILELYDINRNIANINYLCEGYDDKDDLRIRVIAKVELCDKSSYIIKFVLEEEHPYKLIEEQSRFSEGLRCLGINTAKRIKCGDKYCCLYSLGDSRLSVTVEEYLGEEIKEINENIVSEISSLMARMHMLSENNNYHLVNDTIWNLWNDNSDIMRGYMKFKELRDKIIELDENNIEIYENILRVYKSRKDKISKLRPSLPQYATQGDYSVNNLTYNNEEIGIFDYNIAGDEILVNDMIIEGLFVTKVMDLSEGLKDSDREELFKLFVKAYINIRKLTSDELNVINDLYAIVVPFWWERIIYNKNKSLVSIINNKDITKLNEFLIETYMMLTTNYFDINNLL